MTRPPPTASIAAVNIARLTGTPLMLLFALYQASTLEGYTHRDGTIEHLSASDLRLCIDARAGLAHEMATYTQDLFAPDHSGGCRVIKQCTVALHGDDVEQKLGRCDVLDAYEGKAVEDCVDDFGLSRRAGQRS